jgi:hypothetical protein
LIASIPAFTVFAWFEQRTVSQGGSLLVNLALFQQRAFSAGVLISLVFVAANTGCLLVLTPYLQVGLGLMYANPMDD